MLKIRIGKKVNLGDIAYCLLEKSPSDRMLQVFDGPKMMCQVRLFGLVRPRSHVSDMSAIIKPSSLWCWYGVTTDGEIFEGQFNEEELTAVVSFRFHNPDSKYILGLPTVKKLIPSGRSLDTRESYAFPSNTDFARSLSSDRELRVSIEEGEGYWQLSAKTFALFIPDNELKLWIGGVFIANVSVTAILYTFNEDEVEECGFISLFGLGTAKK